MGERYIYDVSAYPVSLASCAFFLITYKYVSPYVSALVAPGYRDLPRAKQVEWDTRTISSFHAFLVSTLSIYIFLYDTDTHEDPIWGDSKLMRCACAIVIGYMLSDLLILIRHYKEIGEVFYFVHHAAVIYAYYFVMTYGVLGWFANCRLLAELSTPFVNQRWFMDVLGCSKLSPLFVANGLAMAVSFFLVRLCAIPPYWWKVWSIYGTEPCDALGRIFLVLVSSCLVLDLINVYWGMKIYSGMRKMLRKSAAGSKRQAIDERKAA